LKDHFVRNLISQLNCVSRVAAMENAGQTQRLIKSLTEIVRYKEAATDKLIKAETELRAVDHLMTVFHVRFGDLLHFQRQGWELAADLYLPHYAIMTFVENAMYHAFGDSENDWHLAVAFMLQGPDVLASISDNGSGFFPKALVTDGTQYGTIASTQMRLEALYGADAVKLESEPGRGTRVTLRLRNDVA